MGYPCRGGSQTRPYEPAAHRIVRAFKSFSSQKINELRGTPGLPVWQRGYYEHIIRNESALSRIREYTVNNPLRWELDRKISMQR